MESQSKGNDIMVNRHFFETPRVNGLNYFLNFFSKEEIMSAFEKIIEFKNFFQQNNCIDLEVQPAAIPQHAGKKSFLVCKHNKYITVPTENIAFFYRKYESSVIMCFDRQEYIVDYSLEQIEHLLEQKQFYRLNRQYLINFNAVREVEHYFARKLMVNLSIPVKDKLLVSKEKVTSFLLWLDNR